jgi:hypothetical protein
MPAHAGGVPLAEWLSMQHSPRHRHSHPGVPQGSRERTLEAHGSDSVRSGMTAMPTLRR